MADPVDIESNSATRLGLRENLSQFSLLVVVNAFVGSMVGLERTVVPLIGSEEFKCSDNPRTKTHFLRAEGKRFYSDRLITGNHQIG